MKIHIFLTSALIEVVSFKQKSPNTHWIGGWVGSRAGIDDVEKRQFLAPLRLKL
jgi:hypothetical protein